MSKVPEHEIHVMPNEDGKGYEYEIYFKDRIGRFIITADDPMLCEKAFRKEYKKARRKFLAAVEDYGYDDAPADDADAPSPYDEQGTIPVQPANREAAKAGPSDERATFTMESQDMGEGRRIRVELNQDNLPRDLGNLAALYFDVIYEQDPDLRPEELAKDKDVFHLLVVENNETKSLNFLQSEEVFDACRTFAEEGNPDTAERIQLIVEKMKDLAGGIYAIRKDIQEDMKAKYKLMSNEEIAVLLDATAGTQYQLMFAVPLFIGVDISVRRQIRIHKGYVATTTDLAEQDEMKMYHYYMTGNLDSFIIDNCKSDGPLGFIKDKDGRYMDHSIGLTIGNPDELQDMLSKACPGHTLKDLYATFWVRGLD